MSYPPFLPTRRELGVSTETLDQRRIGTLLLGLAYRNTPMEYVLPLEVVASVAVLDWLTACGVSPDSATRIVLTAQAGIPKFAEVFNAQSPLSGAATARRSPATLMLFDFRYLRISIAETYEGDMVDLDGETVVVRPPEPVLTMLTCDLNVLLLRLFARMEKTRQLKERTDASTNALADGSTTGNYDAGRPDEGRAGGGPGAAGE